MRYKILILLLFITSCAAPPPTVPPITSTVTNTAIPVATSSPIPPTPIPTQGAERPAYTLNTTVDYDRHSVVVDEAIVYPNHSGERLDRLVLAIAANLWQNCFYLDSIQVNGASITDYTLTGHRLEIPLRLRLNLIPLRQ